MPHDRHTRFSDDLQRVAHQRPERSDRIRRQLLTGLRSFVDSAAAVYVGFAGLPEGIAATCVTASSTDEGGTFGHLEGELLPRDFLRVVDPLERESDAFRAIGDLLGFRHAVTATVCHENIAVGCIVAVTGRGRVRSATLDVLNVELPQIRRLLVRAAALEDTILGPANHAAAVVDGAGRILELTAEAEGWLDHRRRARLEARLATAVTGLQPLSFLLDGALATCEPMGSRGHYLISLQAAPRPRRPYNHALSPRQRRICELIAMGDNPPAIADTLGVSEKTVGQHVRQVFKALGVHSGDELRAVAMADDATRPRVGRGRPAPAPRSQQGAHRLA